MQSSEGKDFNFDEDNFDGLDSLEDDLEDPWQPVVLGPNAKRGDYEKVCNQFLMLCGTLSARCSCYLGVEGCQFKGRVPKARNPEAEVDSGYSSL